MPVWDSIKSDDVGAIDIVGASEVGECFVGRSASLGPGVLSVMQETMERKKAMSRKTRVVVGMGLKATVLKFVVEHIFE